MSRFLGVERGESGQREKEANCSASLCRCCLKRRRSDKHAMFVFRARRALLLRAAMSHAWMIEMSTRRFFSRIFAKNERRRERVCSASFEKASIRRPEELSRPPLLPVLSLFNPDPHLFFFSVSSSSSSSPYRQARSTTAAATP